MIPSLGCPKHPRWSPLWLPVGVLFPAPHMPSLWSPQWVLAIDTPPVGFPHRPYHLPGIGHRTSDFVADPCRLFFFPSAGAFSLVTEKFPSTLVHQASSTSRSIAFFLPLVQLYQIVWYPISLPFWGIPGTLHLCWLPFRSRSLPLSSHWVLKTSCALLRNSAFLWPIGLTPAPVYNLM